ncbi:MAG: HmuY family protein [Bacteroidales bacterium]|nr:HmuY family protein [Bacteroidales bacterium]
MRPRKTDKRGRGVLETGCISLLLIAAGCDGMFGSIYDEVGADEGSENKRVETFAPSGVIRVDATSYTRWHYISLRTGERVTTEISLETLGETTEPPAEWDIAIHHYDVRTNNGEVRAERDTVWARDVWREEGIMVDLSQMMDSIIVYSASYRNEVLSGWMEVDLRTMPPIYKMDGQWYRLRTEDGREIRLRLLSYVNEKNIKGHLSIEYDTEMAEEQTRRVQSHKDSRQISNKNR